MNTTRPQVWQTVQHEYALTLVREDKKQSIVNLMGNYGWAIHTAADCDSDTGFVVWVRPRGFRTDRSWQHGFRPGGLLLEHFFEPRYQPNSPWKTVAMNLAQATAIFTAWLGRKLHHD